jgi:hypothetical protein
VPRLTNLPPKAVGLIATTGFAAAGVVAVIAENLRTLSDREEPLPERAKKVGQHSIGAVLAGPSALSERGRRLVGKDGHDGDGDGRDGARGAAGRGTTTPRPTEAGGADTSAAAAPDGDAVPPRGIDTSSSEAAPDTGKPASREQDDEAGAGRAEREADQERAEEAARKAAANAKRSTEKATAGTKRTAREATDTAKSVADRGADRGSQAGSSAADRAKSVADRAEDTADETAERAARATSSVADRTRDRVEEAAERAEDAGEQAAAKVEEAAEAEERTAEKGTAEKTSAEKSTAKKSTAKRSGTADPSKTSGNGRDRGPDVPAGVDEALVADLQRMTVKQLRERAAQDGVAGRSGMSKDELVSALAARETDETPAKG